MSYSSEVLADNPVAYYRCDELVYTTLFDTSVNANHFSPINPVAVLGVPSAIQTDPASSAIRYNIALVPVIPQTDLLDNITMEVWGYWDPSLTLAGTNHLIFRRGQFGLSHNCGIGFNSGEVMFDLTLTNGTFYRLTYGAGLLVVGNWYHIVGVRNGATMNLYVNKVLVATRADLTLDQIDYSGSTLWGLGTSPSTSAFPSAGSDEIALYDTPLSATRVGVHYDAALLALLLNGYSNVVPSAVLYSTIEPDPISFPFRHNWSDALQERISFLTNVSRARTGVEENVQVRPKPRREIEFVQLLRDNAERRSLRAKLWARQNQRWLIPILDDKEQVLAPITVGTTSFTSDHQYRDYEVGGRIGIRQYDALGRVSKSEELVIASITTTINTTTGTVNAYDALHSWIYPVRRGYLSSSISVEGHTDAIEEVRLIARLVPEDEAVVPHRIVPWVPTIKYRDYEVFDPQVWQSNDWSELREYEIERDQHEIDFETGTFSIETDTSGANEAFSYRITLEGRDEIAQFLGWFYDRAGKLNYVWVASMQQDFEVLSVLNANLLVEGTNYSDNYVLDEARRDLAFVYNDNSMEFRRVIGFSGSPNETLVLDQNVPTLTNLRSVSLLKFCRLDGDILEIAKHTDNKWTFAWRFRELSESPAGTGPSSLSPSASTSGSQSPSASGSPSISVSPSVSPSLSQSPSGSVSPSTSVSPSSSVSPSISPSASVSPSSSASASLSPSISASPSVSPSASASPSV